MSITPSERVVAPNHRDISRRKFLALAGVSAFTLSTIGSYSTLAYFTDTDTKVNDLYIAQALDIEVVEPSWDPENGRKVVPTETIPKDPYVHNLSENVPGYMYIEIRIPIVTASIFNEETQKKEDPAEIPLFSYTPNEGWTEINTFIDDTDADNKVQVTRYYWKDVIEPDGVTETIFDEVIVANLTSGEGVSGKHTIEVVGYGIQSEGFDDALSAWTAYKNQNGIKDGITDPATPKPTFRVGTSYPDSGSANKIYNIIGDCSGEWPTDDNRISYKTIYDSLGTTNAKYKSYEAIGNFTLNGVTYNVTEVSIVRGTNKLSINHRCLENGEFVESLSLTITFTGETYTKSFNTTPSKVDVVAYFNDIL